MTTDVEQLVQNDFRDAVLLLNELGVFDGRMGFATFHQLVLAIKDVDETMLNSRGAFQIKHRVRGGLDLMTLRKWWEMGFLAFTDDRILRDDVRIGGEVSYYLIPRNIVLYAHERRSTLPTDYFSKRKLNIPRDPGWEKV